MPHDIDRKALRDLLSDDSDSESFVGIYEYPEITQELTCKYPTSSTRYTGSSSKKSYLAPSSAYYDDQYRRHDDTFADRQRPRDFPSSRRYPQDRTDGEPSSGLDLSRSLFGRSVEEASLDFLEQVRPRSSRRHDVTPSLTSDDTRTGSSSSRFESPGPLPHRHRSPSQQARRETHHVSGSTPHIRNYRDDTDVTLPSIRELDQNINGVSTPAPPSPPGYASRREYEQRRNYLVPRVESPEPPSWHSRYPYGEHDQTVNSPIPRFVSPEPHARPRYPTREVHWRANYPSPQSPKQDNLYQDRHSTREPEQRADHSIQRTATDLYSVPRYPNRAPDPRKHYASTTNTPPDPPSTLYPYKQLDQRLEYSNARNVSPDRPSSFRTTSKQSEQRRNYYPLSRVVSPEPPLSPSSNNYPYAPALSPVSPRDLDSWPDQRDDYAISPEYCFEHLYPDLPEQESDQDITRLISLEPSLPPRAVNSQIERRSSYALSRILSSEPPSTLPLADVHAEQEADRPPTRFVTPAPPPTRTPLSAGAQAEQRIARSITPALVLTPVIFNKEPEQRASLPLHPTTTAPRPILTPVNPNREPEPRTSRSPLLPPAAPESCSAVANPNRESEPRTSRPSLPPPAAPEPRSTPINPNREPEQQPSHPAPRVATPEPPSLPQYPDERAPNFIASFLNNLDIPDASRKAILENNRISTWDFSSVKPPAVTIEVLPPIQQSNKRRAPSPNALTPPKASKAPKAPKKSKAPKSTVPAPALEEQNEIDELAGDVDDVIVPPPPPPSAPSQQERLKTVKKPAATASFICEYCASVFTRNHDKNRHIKTIHQEQTVFAIQSRTCSCCNEVLSREDAFRRHIIKMPDSCIRLAELRSMPLTPDQKKRLLKMHADGIPPRFPFDELFYMYRR